MSGDERSRLLRAWHVKARAIHEQYQASRLWTSLEPHLTGDEGTILYSAWSSAYVSGEYGKFDAACADMLDTWHEQNRSKA